jgi:hypothetical protein
MSPFTIWKPFHVHPCCAQHVGAEPLAVSPRTHAQETVLALPRSREAFRMINPPSRFLQCPPTSSHRATPPFAPGCPQTATARRWPMAAALRLAPRHLSLLHHRCRHAPSGTALAHPSCTRRRPPLRLPRPLGYAQTCEALGLQPSSGAIGSRSLPQTSVMSHESCASASTTSYQKKPGNGGNQLHLEDRNAADHPMPSE